MDRRRTSRAGRSPRRSLGWISAATGCVWTFRKRMAQAVGLMSSRQDGTVRCSTRCGWWSSSTGVGTHRAAPSTWNGLDRQGGPPNEFAYNWYYSPAIWGPLANHQPANGERVGFFVTAGDARAKDVRTVNERSNVVALPFPSGGGYFTFSLMKTLSVSR